MKKKLLITSLLLALIAPTAQAVSLNGGSTPEPITIPSLIPPTTEGGFRGNLTLALNFNPRSLKNDGGLKFGIRIPSRLRGPYVDPTAVENGNGGDHPNVPEPQGFAMALTAGLFGLGFTGYRAHQRRRVLGAA